MTALIEPAAVSTPTRPALPRLRAEAVSLGYDARVVVRELDLDVPDHAITAIVGSNACGKSTLLRGMARLLAPEAGRVVLDGRAVHETPTREVARTLGLLPQSPATPEGVTVAELVARGRHPHRGMFGRGAQRRRDDDEAVAEALELTDTVDLADRVVDELSGGQRQRVWIAMALAQRTDLLLLDEPTSYLDLTHQLDVLELLADLNRRRDTTVVIVLHELNLAARYADHLVVMKDGAIVAAGAPGDVLTEEVVATAFGLAARVVADPVTGTPMVVPVGRISATTPKKEIR